jgi:uncharacterized protein (DUF1800 family)
MKENSRKPLALMTVLAVFAAIMPAVAGSSTESGNASKWKQTLTGDKKIIHLLNRTGYGPRPGDLERVKQLGIDKYIDLQLHPDRISDSGLEARLSGLDSLHMSLREVNEKYPQPLAVAREMGLLKQDLRAGKAAPKPGDPEESKAQPRPEDIAAKLQSREYRRQILQYYQQHGLKPVQRLLQELQAQKLIRAVYSERQLEEVMTDFWFNHFNIDWRKGADRWMTTDYEMNAIRPHVFGKFKDLLEATAKSPAMLFYLDNFQSMSPDTRLPQRRPMRRGQFQRNPGAVGNGRFTRQVDPIQNGRRPDQQMDRAMQANGPQGNRQLPPQAAQQLRRKPGINENYAREIMELHTLGVDGGYTQKDVQEVARCFTGWTIDRPRQGGSFIFRPFMHDNGEKTVLGHKIPAGGGSKDGEMVIDILAHHPSTAKFISTKLVRKFVSDDPPQALVDRVVATYNKTDGDIREMVRTILTSPEFNSNRAYRAKIKSPFDLAASAIRAMGGDTTGSPALAQFVAKMGQPLYQYQAPTGYPDRAEQWVNTGALLERLNFGLAFSANKIPGAEITPSKVTPTNGTRDASRLMDHALTVLLNGDVSSQTRQVLDKQLKEGVPVKGELGEIPRVRNSGESMEMGDDQMPGDNRPGRPRPTDQVARRDQSLERRGMGLQMMARLGPPVDPQLAQVFGLVLGSPEFQRR